MVIFASGIRTCVECQNKFKEPSPGGKVIYLQCPLCRTEEKKNKKP